MGVVAGGVGQYVALTFVEVVESQRVFVGLEAGGRREVGGVAGDLGDADFVDDAFKSVPRLRDITSVRTINCSISADVKSVNAKLIVATKRLPNNRLFIRS